MSATDGFENSRPSQDDEVSVNISMHQVQSTRIQGIATCFLGLESQMHPSSLQATGSPVVSDVELYGSLSCQQSRLNTTLRKKSGRSVQPEGSRPGDENIYLNPSAPSVEAGFFSYYGRFSRFLGRERRSGSS